MIQKEQAVEAANKVRDNHKRMFHYHANEQQMWDDDVSRDAIMARYILQPPPPREAFDAVDFIEQLVVDTVAWAERTGDEKAHEFVKRKAAELLAMLPPPLSNATCPT